jgi:hypothetical protein
MPYDENTGKNKTPVYHQETISPYIQPHLTHLRAVLDIHQEGRPFPLFLYGRQM